MAWLKLDALKKAYSKLVTRDVSHDPIGELKLVLPRNTSVISADHEPSASNAAVSSQRARHGCIVSYLGSSREQAMPAEAAQG